MLPAFEPGGLAFCIFLPFNRKRKIDSVRSLAVPCATYGWTGKKEPVKDTMSYDQTVWRATREPSLAGHWRKRLSLGPKLDTHIGIWQVLNMLRRAAGRTAHPAHPTVSEKPAISWLYAYGWTMLPGRKFIHKELNHTISPLRGDTGAGEFGHFLELAPRNLVLIHQHNSSP